QQFGRGVEVERHGKGVCIGGRIKKPRAELAPGPRLGRRYWSTHTGASGGLPFAPAGVVINSSSSPIHKIARRSFRTATTMAVAVSSTPPLWTAGGIGAAIACGRLSFKFDPFELIDPSPLFSVVGGGLKSPNVGKPVPPSPLSFTTAAAADAGVAVKISKAAVTITTPPIHLCCVP